MPRVLRSRTTGHTHRPRVADVRNDLFQSQIVVENLHSRVTAIAHINVALEVGRDRMRCAELEITTALLPDGLDEFAVLVELHDAGVTVTVRHEEVALLIPG